MRMFSLLSTYIPVVTTYNTLKPFGIFLAQNLIEFEVGQTISLSSFFSSLRHSLVKDKRQCPW